MTDNEMNYFDLFAQYFLRVAAAMTFFKQT